MSIRECGAIRDLAAIECDQVGGGVTIGTIQQGPVSPKPLLPPVNGIPVQPQPVPPGPIIQ